MPVNFSVPNNDDDSVDEDRHINPHAHVPRSEELEVLRAEVHRLKDLVAVFDQGTSEARYFELHKRHRELTVKYEAERARTQKLMDQLAKRDQVDLDRKAPGLLLPSQRPNAATTLAPTELQDSQKEADELRIKLDRAMKNNATLRSTTESLKKDLAKMRRVVALELGDDAEAALAAVGDAFEATDVPNPPRSASAGSKPPPVSGWRSRAQQISILKAKSRELTRQLAAARHRLAEEGLEPNDGNEDGTDYDAATIRTGLTGLKSNATGYTTVTQRRNFDDVNRERVERQERTRLLEVREAEQATAVAREEATKERNRADALQARHRNLERDNQHLKLCVSRMLEKTENDDALIAEYKAQLEAKQLEIRKLTTEQPSAGSIAPVPIAGRRAVTGAPKTTAREASLAAEVTRLQAALAEKNNKRNPSESENSVETLLAERGVLADDDTALGKSLATITTLRKALLAYEEAFAALDRDMQRRRREDVVDLPEELLQQNQVLQERVEHLSASFEKELDLRRAILTEANDSGTTCQHEGRSDEEELEAVKQQLADLKRAYNALALSSQQL